MKNSIVRSALAVVSAAIILAISSEIARAQNSISGIIFDSNRKPVTEIDVELLDEFERLIRSSKTKSSGLYIFQGLRAGVYYIQARTDGTNYRSAKERVQLGQMNRTNRTSGAVSGSEALQVNLTLQIDPRRSGSGRPLYNEVIFAQSVPAEAEKYYRDALRSHDKKDRADTEAALKTALGIFPEYYLALDFLGNEYLTQKKFPEAETLFTKALAVNPKSFSSAYGLGAAQYSLGNRTDAARALEKAIGLNAYSINSYFLLGKIQRESKQFQSAELSLKKASQLADGKLPDIHWELALLYYHNLKRYADAAEALELYLKTNPQANKEQIDKLIRETRAKAKPEKS